MAYSSGAMSVPAYSLNEMLRLNVPLVKGKVFPPGTRIDAQMPRITITSLTPTETRVGIGEGYGAGKGLFYTYFFRVDIFDKDPKQIDLVADQVMFAIWKNRGYTPQSPNDTHGSFLLLQVSGGSGANLNAGLQLYQRTLNVTGKWLAKTTDTWQ